MRFSSYSFIESHFTKKFSFRIILVQLVEAEDERLEGVGRQDLQTQVAPHTLNVVLQPEKRLNKTCLRQVCFMTKSQNVELAP